MDRHKAKKGDRIGLEFQINDADASGARIGTLSWNDETGMGWSKSSVYGTIELAAEAKDEVSDDNSKPGTDDPSTGNTENRVQIIHQQVIQKNRVQASRL